MPVIKTFDAGQLGLQPTEIGVESQAAAGRRLGMFYNQVGQAQERFGERVGQQMGSAIRDVGEAVVTGETHREVSQGAATFASLADDLTDRWNAIAQNADPHDGSVAAKFRDTVLEPALDKFSGAFHTEAAQNWAEHHVEQLRQHMFEKTASDMATRAGQAAVVDAKQLENTLTNMVYKDPSSMKFALSTIDSSVGGIIASSPNIKGVAAGTLQSKISEGLREKVVKAAALSTIQKTGKVPDWISDPEVAKYVSAPEIQQLEHAERYYNNLNRSEERSARLDEERTQKADLNGKLNQIESEMLPQKPGEQPKVPQDVYDRLRQLYVHPGAAFDRSAVEATVRKAEAVDAGSSKPEALARVSHETTMSLLKRIRAQDPSRLTDNQPIYDAYEGGSLNRADFSFLVKEYNDLRTPDGQALEKDRSNFTKSYARLIDGMMNSAGEHSLLGTQKMYEFEMDARRQENVLRQQGKDPHAVYDPRSPDFFGRPENIARYRVTMQEAQKYEKDIKAMDEEIAKKTPATGFAPPSNWQWNPARRQYRDPEGNLYDFHGQPVKKSNG